MKKFFQYFGAIFIALLILGAVSTTYFMTTRGPKDRAHAAMRSSDQVEVVSDRWEIFSPRNSAPTTGVIFYPGTFVDPKAYAEPAHALSAEGYLVVLVPMPLGMAVMAPNRAEEVQAAFPNISTWVIAGHSQGGAYAFRYALTHPNDINGLILWAGRPMGNDDLSSYDIPVLSINGSLDPRRSPEILEIIKMRLPADAVLIDIEGGTHEYFGDYVSSLDAEIAGKAISHDMQTEIIVRSTDEFLESLSAGE